MLAGLVQNMITPIELIQAVVDGMAARGFGRIVNITSVAVLTPIQGLALSSGARAGLTAFLGGVCREVGPQGVTINNLLPDRIATDRLKARIQWHAEQAGTTPEEEERRQASEVPVGRFGTPDEFGQICAFLCSRHASYITGRNIPVDGGLMRAVF